MSEKNVLDQLVEATARYPGWRVLREAIAVGRTIHLAVMVEPFLSFILSGQKTIESRFSKNAIAPFQQIRPDDLVLLKLTGGPIVGCFTTRDVEFINLSSGQLDRLRREYSAAICADDDFWAAREDKRYATLVGVHAVHELRPAPVAKSDRRGWVVLQPSKAPAGVEQLALV